MVPSSAITDTRWRGLSAPDLVGQDVGPFASRWVYRDDRIMSKRSAIETDPTPFSPAHAAVDPDGLTRLAGSKAVLDRYKLTDFGARIA